MNNQAHINQKLYKINKVLGQGNFSKVLAGYDKETFKKIVIKLNKEEEMNEFETILITKLNAKKFENFPQIIGKVRLNGTSGLLMN